MIVKNRLISRPTLSEAHVVCALLSPSCAQSLCDFRLHGVSHDAASPMPVPSNSRMEGICGFFCGWAIFFEIKGRFGTVVALSYYK